MFKPNDTHYIILIHNVYSIAVEIISSLAALGNNFAIPAGVMQEKFGHRPTLVFFIVITFTFLMLLWSAQYYMHFYIQHAWLLYIYFFLIGKYNWC